jgi:hypothetical protein
VPVGGSGQLFSGPHVFLHPSTRPTAAASAVATQQLAGAAHLVQAGAWAKYGSSTLSHLHALVYLACYGSHSRLEDTAAAMAAVIEAIKTRQGERVNVYVYECCSSVDFMCVGPATWTCAAGYIAL